MKKVILVSTALLVFLLASCGANVTIDNKTDASSNDVTWDLNIKLSGQDYGTVKTGTISAAKNVGAKLTAETFSINDVYYKGNSVWSAYTSAQKAVIQSSLDSFGQQSSGSLDAGDYTWYLGVGSTGKVTKK